MSVNLIFMGIGMDVFRGEGWYVEAAPLKT